jgi:hypothetical protein
MRSPHLYSIAALCLALGLSACGGKESFSVSGTINRLDYAGLVLANGNDTVRPEINATNFTFPNRIDYGTEYNVTIQTPPQHMNCKVAANGKGSAGRTAVIKATVTCAVDTHTVGGTITGLTGAGLELINGNDNVAPAADATTFTFPKQVAFGQTYGVRVKTQPAGQTCTVPNDEVTMGDKDVANIVVTCEATTPST